MGSRQENQDFREMIKWHAPTDFVRGVLVSAMDTSRLEDLETDECWKVVLLISQSLARPNEDVNVTCEIWADTGRLVWILNDRREFGRVVLKVDDIEKTYFAMLTSPTFAAHYNSMLTRIRRAVEEGLKSVDSKSLTRVTVRDSDDNTTEEEIKRT